MRDFVLVELLAIRQRASKLRLQCLIFRGSEVENQEKELWLCPVAAASLRKSTDALLTVVK